MIRVRVLFAYYYAHIPRYAVVNYLTQDDWARWDFGNAPGTRSSNFKGEFRLAYAIGQGFNVVTRAYVVKGIKKDNPADVALESGHRLRLDVNLNF